MTRVDGQPNQLSSELPDYSRNSSSNDRPNQSSAAGTTLGTASPTNEKGLTRRGNPEPELASGEQALVSSTLRSRLDSALIDNLTRSQAPKSDAELDKVIERQARYRVLDNIERLRAPKGPASQAVSELWRKTSEADGLVEQAAGAVATVGMIPVALAEESLRAVVNMPSHAAELGARMMGVVVADTKAERIDHATGALHSGARTVEGILVGAALTKGSSFVTAGAEATTSAKVLGSATEQGVHTLLHSDAEGAELARDVAAGVIGGASTELASSVCGYACGGAVGQLVQDGLSGNELSADAMLSASVSNAAVNRLADKYKYQGPGKQFTSSEAARWTELESSPATNSSRLP